jgi:hypothetical protein
MRCEMAVTSFSEQCPQYPRDTAHRSALLGMAVSEIATYITNPDFHPFDDLLRMLKEGLIKVEDIPYLARITTSSNPGIDDACMILPYIEELLRTDIFSREDIQNFFWPLCKKLHSSRLFAILGIKSCIEAGLRKEEIMDLFIPFLELGTSDLGHLISCVGVLLERHIITTDEVNTLILPLLRLNPVFSYASSLEMRGILANEKVGKQGLIDFLGPFVQLAEGSTDMSGMFESLEILLAYETWTTEDIHAYILPLFEAGGEATWKIMGEITSALERGVITKQDILRYILPIVRVFGKRTWDVLYMVQQSRGEISESRVIILGNAMVVNESYVPFFSSSSFIDLKNRYRDQEVDSRVVYREIIIPLIDRALENLEEIFRMQSGLDSNIDSTLAELIQRMQNIRKVLIDSSRSDTELALAQIEELFTSDLTKERRVELIRSLGDIGVNSARRALEAELLSRSSLLDREVKSEILRALVKINDPVSLLRINIFMRSETDESLLEEAQEAYRKISLANSEDNEQSGTSAIDLGSHQAYISISQAA